ncbi:UNVERIFIED_CONTAM: AMSH-like ubiquitin thioesterase 2 [Sesamum angustifolium]|uniref:AMSH-like ubiquitin thioesterase 2 n=1 Tax=Sesamum angustifolium TaxID=2727405 RepID=A0AAW2KCP1_9LAMI
MAGETCCKIDVHSVTKYFPSPGISFLQPPPHEPETSRFSVQNAVDDQSNSSSNQQAASKHLKDIHMVMVPEAVGIVMAPTDDLRKYGIFRLSDPDGMSILRECHEMGFHTHRETSNGSPIYEDSTNIIFNPNLRLEIFDLR